MGFWCSICTSIRSRAAGYVPRLNNQKGEIMITYYEREKREEERNLQSMLDEVTTPHKKRDAFEFAPFIMTPPHSDYPTYITNIAENKPDLYKSEIRYLWDGLNSQAKNTVITILDRYLTKFKGAPTQWNRFEILVRKLSEKK